jgi:hypothetical protein
MALDQTGRGAPIIAFDIEGTLIHQVGEKEDTPRYEIIQLVFAFKALGCQIVIWTGHSYGVDFSLRWVQKLGLDVDACMAKPSFSDPNRLIPDIAFDDMKDCKLGKVNIQV